MSESDQIIKVVLTVDVDLENQIERLVDALADMSGALVDIAEAISSNHE